LQTEEDVNDELNNVNKMIAVVIEEFLMQFTEKKWKEFEKIEIKLLIMS